MAFPQKLLITLIRHFKITSTPSLFRIYEYLNIVHFKSLTTRHKTSPTSLKSHSQCNGSFKSLQ